MGVIEEEHRQAQDVFLQLYRALPSIKSEEHVTAWLYKVTSHRCVDYARRRRRDLSLDEIPEPVAEAGTGVGKTFAMLSAAQRKKAEKTRKCFVIRPKGNENALWKARREPS